MTDKRLAPSGPYTGSLTAFAARPHARRVARGRALALVLLLAFAHGACTPKMRAKRLLGKYEKVFATCRKLTEDAGARPGEHSCAKVASLAVEGSLGDTGLAESEWRPMLSTWLAETGFAPYYIDSSRSSLVAAPLVSTAPSAPPAAPVPSARTKPTAPRLWDGGAAATKPAAYSVGAKVSVHWGDRWWPATVLTVKADKYLIHYDGWASSWDEWVTPARMKPR
ncbi:MAG: hypothetical protein HYZ29_37155 [Myxococcales bacterium]|nr:hypothetical protein [Myxococcales bacterium]